MLTVFALILFLFTFILLLDTTLGARTLPDVLRYSNTLNAPYPTLSIVFAARNEERNIETAVRSLLQIDYPNLAVVAVNDRSTDRTPTILEKLAQENSHLKVVTIDTLPTGWLGKNHALSLGAKELKSDLILFTDADIHFDPSTLKRVVNCLVTENWDHITFIPRMKVPTFFLNLCVGVFGMLFFSYTRPWKARDPKSKYFLGIGAFNLLKREVYEKIGTFEAIRLRPDDDLKLGKLVKEHGFRQTVLNGRNVAYVEWYSNLKEFVKGLEKNMYAAADYRFFFMVLSTLSMILTFLFPYAGIYLTNGLSQALLIATVVLQLLGFIYCARVQGTAWYTFVLLPLGIVIYIYVIWNAILKTIFQNGIEWRGTFYPLEELKKNKV